MIKITFILTALLACAIAYANTSKEEEALFVAKRAFEDGFYDVSLTLFNRFLDKYPDTSLRAEADLYTGQCYFYKKKYIEALDQFKKILDSKQGNSFGDKLYYWIAEVYFKMNNFGEAYNFYEKLNLTFPKSPYSAHAYYSLGWCLLGQGRFEAAKDKFIEFKTKFPHDALTEEAAFKAAECLYNLKDYSSLIKYSQDLNKEYPKSAKIEYLKFYLGESFFYIEDYNSAIVNYTEALKKLSDNNLKNLIYLGLGWSYLKNSDYQNAKNYFGKVIEASQDKKNIESALLGEAIILQSNSQFKESIAIYDKLISDKGVSQAITYEAYIGKAESLCGLSNYKEAVSVYKQTKNFINNQPSVFSADRLYYGLGISQIKFGNLKEARQEFLSLVNESKDEALKISALLRLADAYLEAKDNEGAVKLYDEIVKDYPANSSCDYAYYGLGVGLFNLKRYKRAIDVFKELIAKYPKSQALEASSFYLATAYFETGDFFNSYLEADKFINTYSESNFMPRALILEGLSLKSLRKFQEACDVFKSVVKNYNQDMHITARAEFEIADCLYYLDRKQESLEKLESLRSKYADPEIMSDVLWRLSEHYFRENNFDMCRRYLLSIIQEHPQSSFLNDSYYMLGVCLEKQENYSEALNVFKKVVGMQSLIYPRMAGIYKALYDYPKAISYYRLGLEEKDTDKPLLQFNLAECLEESGRLDEAVVEYSRIEKDSQLAVKGLLRSAQIFENREDWEGAIRIYEKIIGTSAQEEKFAKERIEFIRENYYSAEK